MALDNELYIGADIDNPILHFSASTLRTVTGRKCTDLIGDELSIDVLEPTIEYTFYVKHYLEPADDYDALETTDGLILCPLYNTDPAEIPYGTPVWYYTNGQLADKYYFKYAERTARYQWIIHAQSIVGMLDMEMHRGGVYTGKTFAEVMTEFFSGTVGESSEGLVPIEGGICKCSLEDDVASTAVHGLLPYATKRENLHQLIFCYCVNLQKDSNGDLIFSYLRLPENPQQIPSRRIYSGANIGYEQPVTDVELTEYTYVYDESVEAESVYDNTSAPHISGEALVLFDKPVNPTTLTTSETTMTIRDANAISAYVTGNGIIYGKPYQTQERVLSKSVEGTTLRKTVTVDGLKLVNPLNSANIMEKLFEFYTQRQKVTMSIEVNDEKPGAMYEFLDPYGETVTGFISSMEHTTTGIVKADCEVITHYIPAGVMTNMKNVVLLQGNGVWNVPSSVKAKTVPIIRAVIVGGGSGGSGGNTGATSEKKPQYPGAGGTGGEGGTGGKVLTVEIDCSDIDSFTYSSGIGGEGGESDTVGAEGTATTFGEYSSDDGAHTAFGVINLIDGKRYGYKGSAGLPGGSGGKGVIPASSGAASNEEILKEGEKGEDIAYKDKTYTGGRGSSGAFSASGGISGWAVGGGGGGAAIGGDGGKATDGCAAWQAVIGGSGGKGGDATIAGVDAQYCGCGGNGGNGGGGGGAPGTAGSSLGSAPTGNAGKGGKGSKGGRGASGGILIYY
jgi:hypothetical protein